MRVIGVIPSRWGSTRFPGKSLHPVLGKPLVCWVVEAVQRARRLDEIIVATDDERIARTVEGFGGSVVMTRSDHATGTDRLAEAAQLIGISDQDVIVNIQGDQPLFPAEIVEQVARPLIDDPSLPMATLLSTIVRPEEITDPNHVKTVFDCHGNALYFSRSPIPFQRDPGGAERPTYYKHLGFYAYRKGFLVTFVGLPEGQWERFEKLEQLRALEFGYTIRVVLTAHDSIEVDTPDDLVRVEQMLAAR